MTATTGRLKICKASAGSGKTFTLAVEYIKHLVMNPSAYRKILAVTFTNKATAEMKQRITSQLYGISRSLDDSKDYVDKIIHDPTITAWYARQQGKSGPASTPPLEELVRSNCRQALTMIIHDYHRFRIETIDSFFQTIVRELAHDLSLTANLKVELDKDSALQEGVNRVIEAIVEDKRVSQRVFNYVESKMDENKNWSVNRELEQFGQNIFDENFLKFGKDLRAKLDTPHFLANYTKTIQRLKDECLLPLIADGQQFVATCARHGLTTDHFKGKSRSAAWNFFNKLAALDPKAISLPNTSASLLAHLEDLGKWSDDREVQRIVEQEELIPLLGRSVKQVADALRIVATVDEIRLHLNQLSLINTISKKVNDAIGDRGEFLLANTNHFLNEMIAESDVPFIYERTGTHFDHIMIDEFQDTSVLQWENFKPLIKNCLDANHECLVVGDVKQSIYRWRNGEWSILNGMADDPQLKPFVTQEPLKTNYRSAARVIKFNNQFFELASQLLSETYAQNEGGEAQDILNAYSECKQEIPGFKNSDTGYVRIELKERWRKDEDIDRWHCRRVAWNVEQLLKSGVPQSQIVILVRKNDQATQICDYFDKEVQTLNGEQVKMVSQQAYRLDSSPAIRLIVLALKTLQNPSDKTFRAMLAYYYQTDVAGNTTLTEDFDQLFESDTDSLNAFLPQALTSHSEELALIPLYELCERLYAILSLNRITGQDAYLFAFYDHVNRFLEGNNTDTENFLSKWDEKLHKETINNGSADGIRVLSIHKSKGLEFHSVIIPFASWDVVDTQNNKRKLIWCKPEESPFDELPLCPVRIVKNAGMSIFSADYKAELLKQYVDNINVLYVGFTRASENLIVISNPPKERGNAGGEKPQKKKPSKAKADGTADADKISTMYHVLAQSMPAQWKAMAMDDGDEAYTAYEAEGSSIAGYRKKTKRSDNVMISSPEMSQIDFRSGKARSEFRQSNRSRRFIAGEDLDGHRTKYLDEGILFHAILSEIETIDDVDRAVRRLDMEGCFDNAYHREDVKRLVKQAFQDPRSSIWFDSKWTVMNENSIVWKDADGTTSTSRPDRVITDGDTTIVIDYKTGVYRPAHEEQVKRYMTLLAQMGYAHVSGYLWYIRQQSIVEVQTPSIP